MKEWQFNVLFFVGVGGVVLLLIGPSLGITISNNPTALTGVGAILAYVLAQKASSARQEESNRDKKKSRKNSKEG